MSEPLLQAIDVVKEFPGPRIGPLGLKRATVHAVNGVNLTLDRGETLGVVGESGCGKSTLGRVVMHLLPATSGEVRLDGVSVETLQKQDRKALRRKVQMVFQDPYASLNPRMTAHDIVAEPMIIHSATLGLDARRRTDRVAELLDLVGLGAQHLHRFPHEFSGGQRQRIGIARALIVEPEFLVADEPVSALDVSIQAQIVNLLLAVQARMALTVLFITHDLAVVGHLAHRVAVMYLGRLVEIADRDELYRNPLHPYTEALMAAVPVADPEVEAGRPRTVITGEVPSALRPPPGCAFHTRCPRVMARCRTEQPQLREAAPGRAVACHLHD